MWNTRLQYWLATTRDQVSFSLDCIYLFILQNNHIESEVNLYVSIFYQSVSLLLFRNMFARESVSIRAEQRERKKGIAARCERSEQGSLRSRSNRRLPSRVSGAGHVLASDFSFIIRIMLALESNKFFLTSYRNFWLLSRKH